jgi:hypothetical protein
MQTADGRAGLLATQNIGAALGSVIEKVDDLSIQTTKIVRKLKADGVTPSGPSRRKIDLIGARVRDALESPYWHRRPSNLTDKFGLRSQEQAL